MDERKTVADLIEILSKFPQDALVGIHSMDNDDEEDLYLEFDVDIIEAENEDGEEVKCVMIYY